MKTSVIEVHDMLSVLSVDELERRLGEVPGVKSVTVNYATGRATVRYDETRLEIADLKATARQRWMEPATGPGAGDHGAHPAADDHGAHPAAVAPVAPAPAGPQPAPGAPATAGAAAAGGPPHDRAAPATGPKPSPAVPLAHAPEPP